MSFVSKWISVIAILGSPLLVAAQSPKQMASQFLCGGIMRVAVDAREYAGVQGFSLRAAAQH
jgi:hypothetical protein